MSSQLAEYRRISLRDFSHVARQRRVVRIMLPNVATDTDEAIAAAIVDAGRMVLRSDRKANVVQVFAYRPGTDPDQMASAGRCVVSRDGKGWTNEERVAKRSCAVTLVHWHAALAVADSSHVVTVRL